MKILVRKASPSKSLMNCCLLSKLWPLIKLLNELKSASLSAKSSSLSQSWVRLRQPSFEQNFYTSSLFCAAVLKIEQALLRIDFSLCVKIIVIISVIPPDKHKLWLLRGCSSTSSWSSSSKFFNCSLVRDLSSLICLQISCKRSVSLNV